MEDSSTRVAVEAPQNAGVPGAAQWFGVLGPPLAMLVNLGVGYALVPWSCTRNTHFAIHLLMPALLLVSIAAGVVAHREWRRAGRGPGDESAAPAGRARFLAVLGIASSALFSVVILAEWWANAWLWPCAGA